MIRYCKRCLYPSNHALNLVFDEMGICSGCRVHEEKDAVDFDFRRRKLESLLGDFVNRRESNYDCIIPVTGGQDSFFIVHMVKHVFGMNPLLVTYNSHFSTPEGIRNLAKIRMVFGVDLIQSTVSPEKVKKIVKATLRKFGSIYWHVIAGQTVYPVQMAVQLKIPLIIWGAHQGMEQSGMFAYNDYVEMTRKYRKEHDCMGFEAEDLIDEFDEINHNCIAPFIYPSNREIEKIGVRGIYLNNFIRWDSRSQHEFVIQKYGYESRIQTRTFDMYSNPECYLYSDIHDYIKWVKHGYGKVNDHVAREIRLGHMDQAAGLNLINNYQSRSPEYLEMFCDWLGVKESGFKFVLDEFRNKEFWQRNDEWGWDYHSGIHLLETGDQYRYPDRKEFVDYLPTERYQSDDCKDDFILIGRGYKPS